MPEHFFFFPYIPLRGTPLYKIAEEEGLLLTNKKNLHYLSAANDRQFTLNMKEQPELLTQDEYNEICQEMLAFQERNNRLTYSDEEEASSATVADKSFSLTEETTGQEDEMQDEILDPAAGVKQAGLMTTVRNFFSR